MLFFMSYFNIVWRWMVSRFITYKGEQMWKKRKECEAVFSKTLPRTKTGYQIIYSIKISKLGLSIYFIKN